MDYSPTAVKCADTIATVMKRFDQLDGEQSLVVLGELLSKVAEKEHVYVSSNFLPLSLSMMKQLSVCGHSNILYGLAQGLRTKRADGTDSLFSSKNLITGLFEYCVQFFNAGNNSQHVSIRNVSMLITISIFFF